MSATINRWNYLPVKLLGGDRVRGNKVFSLIGVGVLLSAAVVGCGNSIETGTINIYMFPDGMAPITKTANDCMTQAKAEGKPYTVKLKSLPRSADDQRLQLARRLAGNDKTVDIMGLDVVWTAEFANAGWLTPVPEELSSDIEKTNFAGPVATAKWKTESDSAPRLYAVPVWTNTQLLWYRPDILKKYVGSSKPPKTWEEVISTTAKIRDAGGPSYVLAQGKQYEGLMVWFNSILVSAGGSVVDPNNPTKVTLNDTPEHRKATETALRIIKNIATMPGADPNISNGDEGTTRLGMEKSSGLFELNWPFVFPGMRTNAAAGSVEYLADFASRFPRFTETDYTPTAKEVATANAAVQQKFTFARYPGVEGGTSKTTLGGNNLAVSALSEQKELSFRVVRCLTNAAAEKHYGIAGGTPPVLAALFADEEFQQAYPMWKEIKAQLSAEGATSRPATPAYQAISTLLTAKLSPIYNIDPEKLVDVLATEAQKAVDGKVIVP